MNKSLLFLAATSLASCHAAEVIFQYQQPGSPKFYERKLTPINGRVLAWNGVGDPINLDLTANYAPISHTHTFTSLTDKPTTLSGYGITGTRSEFNSAVTDGDIAYIGDGNHFTAGQTIRWNGNSPGLSIISNFATSPHSFRIERQGSPFNDYIFSVGFQGDVITVGNLAAANFSGSSSGTNTGDQTSITGITGTRVDFNTALTDDNFAYSNSVNVFTAPQRIEWTGASQGLQVVAPSSGVGSTFFSVQQKVDGFPNSFLLSVLNNGNLNVAGNITAANFSGSSSGTNTGDQTSITGITGNISQFNAALTGDDFVTVAGASAAYQPLDAGLTALAGGSDFVAFTGPTTPTKTFTLPNANATLVSTATLNSGTLPASFTGVVTPTVSSASGSNLILSPGAEFVEISKTAQNATREVILKASVSDAGTDTFQIFNATSTDNRFVGGFGGANFSGAGANQSMIFNAVTDALGDNSPSNAAMMQFEARRTDSTTNPFNGTFSSIQNRNLFSWRNHTMDVGVVDKDGRWMLPSVQATTGNLSFGTSGKGISGTTTNNNAEAGVVGQYAEALLASGSAIALTTNTTTNVLSLSLTAGDWDLHGNLNYVSTANTVTARAASITTTSATIASDGSESYAGGGFTTFTGTTGAAVPRRRVSLASTTTVYLVARPTFSAGTLTVYGSLTARRAR